MRWLATIPTVLFTLAGAAQSVVFGVIDNPGTQPRAISWPVTKAVSYELGTLRVTVAPEERLVLRSEAVALLPGIRYHCHSELRRGPGTRADWAVLYTLAGEDRRRNLYWQRPDTPQPTHYPLAPVYRQYEQYICLPPEARNVRLEIRLTGHRDAGHDYLELRSLKLLAGDPVPLGAPVGPNFASGGDLEQAHPTGIPVAWAVWNAADPDMQIIAEKGERFLRIGAGQHYYFAAAVGIPVTRGRAYELRFRARGKGRMQVGAHALMKPPRWPVDYRVGGMQPVHYALDTDTWTGHRQIWFADVLHVETAQILFSVHSEGNLDLDAISFRLLSE